MAPRLRRYMALVLVAGQTCLLAWGAYRNSPTHNEMAHLAAGISYWKYARFDLYRVDPPLTRLVAAVPVVALNPKTDWSGFYDIPGGRPEFEMGRDFVTANREQSLWLCTLARWACIPFSWIGARVCFIWARDLFGPNGGLAAC